jgi:hypothetical protein
MNNWKSRMKVPVFVFVAALLLIAAGAGFYFGQSRVSTPNASLNSHVTVDHQPDHGKDCPPKTKYGEQPKKGQEKHCDG